MKVYTMPASNPLNIGSVDYDEERAQNRTLWYTMQEGINSEINLGRI